MTSRQPTPGRAPRGGLASLRPTRWTLFLVAVGGMIVTYVWRFQQLFPVVGQLRPTIVAGLLALVLLMAKPDLHQTITALRHPTFRFMMLMLLWMVLSVPTSIYPGLSFIFVLFDHTKTVLFVVVLAAGIRGFRDLERLSSIYVIGGLIYSMVSLLRIKNARLAGAASYDANDLAMVLVCTLPFALYFAVTKRSALVRLVSVAATGLFTFLIIQTVSRGGLLGLVAVSTYLLFNFRAVRKGVRVATVAVAAVAVLAFAGEEWTAQMRTLLTPTQDYNWNSEAGRMKIWARGMGFMIQRPITGVGVRAYAVAEGTSELARQRALEGKGMKWSVAHNSFVQVGAELGVPGLIFFAMMFWTAFASVHRIGSSPRMPPTEAAMGHALSASVVGFVVTGFFLSAAYYATPYVLMGLAIGFVHVVRTTAEYPADRQVSGGRSRSDARGLRAGGRLSGQAAFPRPVLRPR